MSVTDAKGDVDAQTSGGDMRVRQLTGNLVLRTSGGDIKAEGISGRVDVHTSGGDVEVSLLKATRWAARSGPPEGRFESHSIPE